MKAKDVLTALDELNLLDRLRAKYFDDWKTSDAEYWQVIQIKLDMLEELRGELRAIANAEGVDNAKNRT